MEEVKLKTEMKLKLEEDLIHCSYFDLAIDSVQGIEFDNILSEENDFNNRKNFLKYTEEHNMKRLIDNFYYFVIPKGTIIEIKKYPLNYLNFTANIKIDERLNFNVACIFYTRTKSEKIADKLLHTNMSDGYFVEIIE